MWKNAHAVKAASLFYYLQTRIVSNGNRKRSRSIGTVGDLVPVDSTASCNRKTFPPFFIFLIVSFFFFRKRTRVINRSHADKTAKLNENRRGLRDPRIMSEDLSFSFFEGDKILFDRWPWSVPGRCNDSVYNPPISKCRFASVRTAWLTSSAKDWVAIDEEYRFRFD